MSEQLACHLSELPDEVGALRVEFEGGVEVAIVRDEDGKVHAIGDICTHANVSLAEGEVIDCTIECWLHGSAFDLNTGEALTPPATAAVPVYAVRIDGDDVYVDITKTNDTAGATAGGATEG